MFKGNVPGAALTVLVFLCLVIFAGVASASTATPGGGSGLQWETPIQMITRSLSGPVAFGFAILALVAAAVTFAFGAELSGFLKTTLNIVLALSILMFSVPLLGTLFAGAVVPDVLVMLKP